MHIAVIDTKINKVFICSKTDAAKIIGVCTRTILRWSYKAKKETYRNYIIYFYTEIIKEKKGNSNMKSHIYNK